MVHAISKPRTIWKTTDNFLADDSNVKNTLHYYLRRLSWEDLYIQLLEDNNLYQNPIIVEYHNFTTSLIPRACIQEIHANISARFISVEISKRFDMVVSRVRSSNEYVGKSYKIEIHWQKKWWIK